MKAAVVIDFQPVVLTAVKTSELKPVKGNEPSVNGNWDANKWKDPGRQGRGNWYVVLAGWAGY